VLKKILIVALIGFGAWIWAAPRLSGAAVLDWAEKN